MNFVRWKFDLWTRNSTDSSSGRWNQFRNKPNTIAIFVRKPQTNGTSVDQYWSKVCGETNFLIANYYGSVAQSVERWPVEQEVRGSNPASGKVFLMIFHLCTEMNQMVNKKNNNNSSNSLVFGLWLQTVLRNYHLSLLSDGSQQSKLSKA